jgi:predicted nucleic acid-binding protein
VSKKLLISDANIFIDIIAGGLVEAMFKLDFEYGTPDVLYAEELQAQHPEIVSAGLRLYELQADAINDAINLFQAHPTRKVSANDCMALMLAKQEGCTLLTGDAMLRQLALTQGVEVRGTLWLVQAMFENGLVTASEAETAYRKMIDDGSRLPEPEIRKQLRMFRK